jgi:hypothetical protein
LTEQEGISPTTEHKVIDFKSRKVLSSVSDTVLHNDGEEIPEEPKEGDWTVKDAIDQAVRSELSDIVIIGAKEGKLFFNAATKGVMALYLIEYAKFLITHEIMRT